MIGGNPVNLVIVYDKDAKIHAEYLRDLIGGHDDVGEKIVGIKDGSVKAVLMEDKEFLKNEKNNTSEQKVVYVGECKGTESVRNHARWKIDKYGLKCGWFANKAVLYVDKKLKKKDDYDAFFKYGSALANEVNEKFQNGKERTTAEKVGKAVSVVGVVAWTYVPIVGIPGIAYLLHENSKHAKKIEQQQYDTLVRAFYLKHCKDFIEGKI